MSKKKATEPIDPATIPAAGVEQAEPIATVALMISPLNPRKRVNPTQQGELNANIRQYGITVPLIVRPRNGDAPPNITHEILSGGRRWREAVNLGMSVVPAIVRNYTDAEAREFCQYENLQRADVHPMEQALGYKAVLEGNGYDVKALATRLGKPELEIYRRLSLCNLIEEAQSLFLEGKVMGFANALRLARLQPTDQKTALERFFKTPGAKATGGPSTRDLDHWIENYVLMVLKDAPFKSNDAALVPEAGSCDACPKRTGANSKLWDEVGGDEDCCTDPTCFNQKVDALLKRERERLAKKHKLEVVDISDAYSTGKDTGPLPTTKYKLLAADGSENCETAQVGLVVESHQGQVGEHRFICTNPLCETHFKVPKHAATTGQVSDIRKKQLAAELDTHVRMRTAAGVLTRYPKEIPRQDLELMCRTFTNRLTADDQRQLWKLMGWVIPKGHMGRPDDAQMLTGFKIWADQDLYRYLVAVWIASDLKLFTDSVNVGKFDGCLFDLAKRLKVPVEDIKTYCRDEQKACRLRGKARDEALASLKEPDAAAAKAGWVSRPEPAKALETPGKGKKAKGDPKGGKRRQ